MFAPNPTSHNRLLALEQELLGWQRLGQSSDRAFSQPNRQTAVASRGESEYENGEVWHEESWNESNWSDESFEEDYEKVDQDVFVIQEVWQNEQSPSSQRWLEDCEFADNPIDEAIDFIETNEIDEDNLPLRYSRLADILPNSEFRQSQSNGMQPPDLPDQLPIWTEPIWTDEPNWQQQNVSHSPKHFRTQPASSHFPEIKLPDPDPTASVLGSSYPEDGPSYRSLSELLQTKRSNHFVHHREQNAINDLEFDPFQTIDVEAQAVSETQTTSDPAADSDCSPPAIDAHSSDTTTQNMWDHLTQSLSDLANPPDDPFFTVG